MGGQQRRWENGGWQQTIRRHLRAIVRLLVLCALTTAFFLAILGAKLAGFFAHSGGAWLQTRSLRLWAGAVLALLAVRVEVRGLPPAIPSLLVANHLGYIDTLLLATQTSVLFVAKSEVATWPVIGFLCRALQTVFVDRKRKRDLYRVIGEITAALRQQRTVVFFPEGTSTAGALVLPFKSSLFEAAVRTGVPVSWASLTYRTFAGHPSASQAVCWWGEMTFAPHLYTLLQLPSFHATITFGERLFTSTNRKTLAARAWVAVAGHFTPVVSAPASPNVHCPVTVLSHGLPHNDQRRPEPPEVMPCQTPSPEQHGASGDLAIAQSPFGTAQEGETR